MNITIERILGLMKEKGVKQAFIADLIGSYQSVVTDWKRGRSTPNQDELLKLARYFGVSMEYLTGKSNDKEATHDGQPLSSTKKLLFDKAKELSDDEIKKIIEYADFVKSQRKQ